MPKMGIWVDFRPLGHKVSLSQIEICEERSSFTTGALSFTEAVLPRKTQTDILSSLALFLRLLEWKTHVENTLGRTA